MEYAHPEYLVETGWLQDHLTLCTASNEHVHERSLDARIR